MDGVLDAGNLLLDFVMEDSKTCPPCLIGRIVAIGLIGWGAWGLFDRFLI